MLEHKTHIIYINVLTGSHQIGLFVSMTKSPSLSVSTGKNLALLRQEHRVELAQDHLQK